MCDLKKSFSDWLELKNPKLNKKKLCWGFAFLILGIILLVFCWRNSHVNLIQEIINRRFTLFWVLAWSNVGIGIGLINRRIKENHEKPKGRDDQHVHYIVYYLFFALLVTSLAAYALGKNEDGTLNKSLSALIALTLGFVAEKINELGIVKN